MAARSGARERVRAAVGAAIAAALTLGLTLVLTTPAAAQSVVPYFVRAPETSDVGAMSFALAAEIGLGDADSATLRYVLLVASAAAPSCAEVVAGTGAGGARIVVRASGSVAAVNGTDTTTMVRPPPWPAAPGVFAGETYAIHACVIDDDDADAQSAVASVEVVMASAPSADAALGMLTVQPIDESGEAGAAAALNPPLAPSTLEYQVAVNSTAASVLVSAIARSRNVLRLSVEGASEALIGLADNSVDVGGAVSLHIGFGENLLGVRVMAEDSITERTYTLRLMRPLSSNARLSNMRIPSVALTPAAFDPSVHHYDASVPYEMESIQVRPWVEDPNHQAMYVQAVLSRSGERSHTVQLAPGATTTVTVRVIAQDARTEMSYVIDIIRAAASDDASLSALNVFGHSLSPAFDADTFEYNVTTVFDNAYVMLSATANSELHEGITIMGRRASSGEQIVLPVEVGETDIDVVVTPQDTRYPRTYALVVVRLGPSEDATLSSLEVATEDDGRVLKLEPDFSPTIREYTATARARVLGVHFRATGSLAGDAAGRQTIRSLDHLDQVVEGEQSDRISLDVGENQFAVEVTAEDGETTLVYVVTVTRLALDNDATLRNVTVTAGELEPAFSPSAVSYSLALEWWQVSLQVTPMANQSYYSHLSINGAPQQSNSLSGTIDAPVGTSTIELHVIAEDRVSSMTYTITVVRASEPVAEDDNTLFALSVEWELDDGTHCSTASEQVRRIAWERRSRAAAEAARSRWATRSPTHELAPADRTSPPSGIPDDGAAGTELPANAGAAQLVDASLCRPVSSLSPAFVPGDDEVTDYTLAILGEGRPTPWWLTGGDSTTANPFMPVEVTMTPSNNASQVHVISNVGAFVDEWTYVLDLQDLPAERADVMIDGVRFFVDRSPFAFRVISPSDDARDFRINFVILEPGTVEARSAERSAKEPMRASELLISTVTATLRTIVRAKPTFDPPENVQVVTLTSTFPDLDVTLFEDDESEFYTGFVDNARTVVAEGLGVPVDTVVITDIVPGSVEVVYAIRAQSEEAAVALLPKLSGDAGVEAFADNEFFADAGIAPLPVEAVVAEVVYIMPGVVDADIFGYTTAVHDVVNQTDLDGGDSYVLNMDPDAWSEVYPQYRVYFDEHTVEARIALSFTDPGFQTAEVQKLPSADDDGANASLTFSLADGKLSPALPLDYFGNVFSITVSDDVFPGESDVTYTVTIIRAGETDAELSALALRSEVIDQDFRADRFEYTATVGLDSSSVALIATANSTGHKGMLVRYRDKEHALTSGSASPPLELVAGESTAITVEVTAMDGNTQLLYTIDVFRIGPSRDSTLKDLRVVNLLTDVRLSPQPYRVFEINGTEVDESDLVGGEEGEYLLDPGNGVYNATLPPDALGFLVSAEANDTLGHASIEVNGEIVVNGRAHAVALERNTWGEVTQMVRVTCVAEDRGFSTTYTINVGRALALTDDPTDASVALVRGRVLGDKHDLLPQDRFELRPYFQQHVLDYELHVSTLVDFVELEVTPANEHSQLRANRKLVDEPREGFNASVALAVESYDSVIELDVVSQNGEHSISYRIALKRHGVGVPPYGYERPKKTAGAIFNW